MPSTKRLCNFRLNDEDFEKIKLIASRDNRSMSNYIESLVKQSIEKYEKKNGTILLEPES